MKILFHKKYPAVGDGQVKDLVESMIYTGVEEYTTSTYMLVDMLRLYLAQGKIDNLSITDEETGYTIEFTEYGTYPVGCSIPRNFDVWTSILHQLLTTQSEKYKERKKNIDD